MVQLRTTAALASIWIAWCGPATAMSLSSHDIAPGAQIAPEQIYPRCGGQNVSPDLSWSGAPSGTKSFVVTMIDTDVMPSQWSHWIVVDLSPVTASLARGLKTPPPGAKAQVSNFGEAAYDGPCPPTGTGVHHYRITIWAMPAATTMIAPDAKATDVTAMLSRSALDRATLTGWVER
jgi:Raf kinase inhibitor-like YbhB/YbcL family protein